jgi:subtilisin-like proprotein convertase family protein
MYQFYTKKKITNNRLKNIFKKTLLILFLSISSTQVNAQVELISTTDGSFENVNPAFIDNGWTTVQGADNRIWRIGTPAGANTGTNAAYTGTATNNNGFNLERVNHFYRDVVIPAGATNVQLKFYYRQPNIDDGYDYFYVSTTDPVNTPVQNAIPDANYNILFSNTSTSYPNFTLLGPFDLTALAGTTVRLVFSAEADGAIPIGNPAVDDISLSYIPSGYNMGVTNFIAPAAVACYTNNETISATIVNSGNADLDLSITPLTINAVATGPNPFVFPNIVLNTGIFAAGTSQIVTISNGYDMSVTGIYNITVNTSVANDAATNNDTYTMSFEKVDNPIPVVTPSAASYCEGGSVALLAAPQVIAAPIVFTNNTLTPIPDSSPNGVNSTITAAGTTLANEIISCTVNIAHSYVGDVILKLTAPDGSIVTLATQVGGLGIDFTSTVFTDTAITAIANGTAPFTGYFLPEQLFSTLTGTANGVWTLNVSDNALLDDGDLLSWSISLPSLGGIATYSWSPATGLSSTTTASTIANPLVTTVYDIVLTNNAGCAGYGSVTVNVNPIYNITQTLNLCDGDSYTVGTNTYNFTGVYTDILQSSAGCDSTVISDLTFNLLSTSNQTLSICSGNSIIVGSNTYTATGIYTDVLTNALGCDSTITTDLTVLPLSLSYQMLSICAGDAVTVGNNTYTGTGIYNDTIVASNGCDSIITTDLTVLPANIYNQSLSICFGNSLIVGNDTLNSTGIFSSIFTASGGCDSTVVTDLTVLPLISNNQSIGICQGDSIVVGTNVYNATGIYTDSLVSANGCDSVITTNLTVNIPYTGTQTFTICEGDSITVGTNTYAIAGTYTDIFSNTTTGCDSTIVTTLNVNLNPVVLLPPFLEQFCLDGVVLALSNGTPIGGTYSGNGITTSPNFNPAVAGLGNHVITYSFTDNNSCIGTATQTLTVTDCTGLEEFAQDVNITVYPNPSNGLVSLNILNAQFNNLQISITDVQGKLIFSLNEKNVNATFNKEINIQEQAKGLYFMNVIGDQKTASIKLVIE